MPEKELPITGYLDRFSHRPGENFTAFVSVRDGGAYRARLVRVLSGDPAPNGPGMRFEDLSHRFDQSLAGRRQAIDLGSYGTYAADRDAMPARRAPGQCWHGQVCRTQGRSWWRRKAKTRVSRC